jgi:hypothetical protein
MHRLKVAPNFLIVDYGGMSISTARGRLIQEVTSPVISTPVPVATGVVIIGRNDVTASSMVCKRGVSFESDLGLRHRANVIPARSFAAPRQLRSIRCHISVPTISLVTSLILTRLDYCNSAPFGLPDVLVSRLQSVQNHCCCSCGLQSTSNCPRHRRPELLSLVAGALVHPLQSRGTGISFAARDIAAVKSDVHLDAGVYDTLQPALSLTSLTGRSTLPSLQLGRPRAFPVSGATVRNEPPTDRPITSALLASAFSVPA